MTDPMQSDPVAMKAGAPRAPWATPQQPSQEPGAPRKGAAAVGHFLRWSVLAVAAVLVVSIAVQFAVSMFGMIAILVHDGSDAGSEIASGDLLAIMIASQLVEIAIFAPWWKRIRRNGLGIARGGGRPIRVRGGREIGNLALVLLAIVLIGIGLQTLISLALTVILPLFPEVMNEYNDLMEAGGTDELSLLSVLSVVVLAPISEELIVRGVALQFALRGICPAWGKRLASEAYPKIEIGPARFWAANAIQALVFGILHLNITQGLYAFVIGMVLGWMFGRTGRLRYGIALHLMVNLASFFAGWLLAVFGVLGLAGQLVLPVAYLACGLVLFDRAAPAGGCLRRGRAV